MANTLSVMTNVLRNVVSKKRIRYKENGFNLDLAYICDNIIAMGYPADNIESIYRNRIDDVYKFLEENHHDHYKIYNLCLERSYDINKFHGRVAVYPFEDHNPPTIELIQKFCDDVDKWLKADNLNVAAVHCKAGKGRTGTMICCYLLYSRQQSTAEDALACYDEKRTRDRKGVTIPSQRRYVQYFSKLIRSGLPYEKRILQLCEIRFIDASLLHNQGLVYCNISVLQDTECAVKVEQLRNLIIDFRNTCTLDLQNPSLSVAGDIKVEVTHKTSRKKIFHFWFNTFFVCDSAILEKEGCATKLVYTLNKCEIDDAHKDKEHKCFSEDFKVQLVFLMEDSTTKRPTNINNQYGNHKTSQTAFAVQNNLGECPQNSQSNTDINSICDQKASSIASVNNFDLLDGRIDSHIHEAGNGSNNCLPYVKSGQPIQSHEDRIEPRITTSPYAHLNGVSANQYDLYNSVEKAYVQRQMCMTPASTTTIAGTTTNPIGNASLTSMVDYSYTSGSQLPAEYNQMSLQSKPLGQQHQSQYEQYYQPSTHNTTSATTSTTTNNSTTSAADTAACSMPREYTNNGGQKQMTNSEMSKLKSACSSLAYPASSIASQCHNSKLSNHTGNNAKCGSISDSSSTSSSSSSSPSSSASCDNEEDWESASSSQTGLLAAQSMQATEASHSESTRTDALKSTTHEFLSAKNYVLLSDDTPEFPNRNQNGRSIGVAYKNNIQRFAPSAANGATYTHKYSRPNSQNKQLDGSKVLYMPYLQIMSTSNGRNDNGTLLNQQQKHKQIEQQQQQQQQQTQNTHHSNEAAPHKSVNSQNRISRPRRETT